MTDIYQLSQKYTAPIIYYYVKWIIQKAVSSKIKTLYFLARDGYVLCKVAQMICEQEGIAIECRYLYCSRNALRFPSYYFIGDEAYHLIFLPGLHVNIRDLFKRIGLISCEIQDQIMKEIGFDKIRASVELSAPETEELSKSLRHNFVFCSTMRKNSEARFAETIAYFRQEHMFEQKDIAIVDSGWSGSLQRSMRQLMQHAGYVGGFKGFYFGFLNKRHDKSDGEYYSWYLTPHSSNKDKIYFNTHLFELMLSAPHGTTLSYKKDAAKYVPVLDIYHTDDLQAKLIDMQIQGILDWVRQKIEVEHEVLNMRMSRVEWNMTRRLLHRIMAYPTREEAYTYGQFAFADDMFDQKKYPLTAPEQCESLKIYNVYEMLYRKIWGGYSLEGIKNIYWPYGTIAFLTSSWKRLWYRWNIYIWHLILFKRNQL